MHEWLAARVKASPNALALMIGTSQWTYAELGLLVNGVCGHLQKAGVTQGQFVGVLMPNTLVYTCLVHALARLGGVLVPLNTRLTPAELEWQIKHTGCDLVLVTEDLAAKLSVTDCKWLVVNETWLERSMPYALPQASFAMHHLQAVVFTSGTSGQPKGAMLTFANHFYSALASAYKLGVQPHDLWLSCLPLYHVGGMAVLWRSCLYGTAVDLHPTFDLEAINHSLDTKPITLISLVPTMLRRLLDTRQSWPESLRLVLLGGAAAAPDLVTRAQAAGVPVATTYGLTEAASQVATMLPEEVWRKPGSVGKALLFTDIKIVDDHGRELPPHQHGEIIVSGPTVMAGYFSHEQALEMGDGNQSHATGDIGYLDDEGDLWLVQRRSDLIVSGGENVYPAEVEAVLKQHPAVADACVVGLPDPAWGQVVTAMIALKAGQGGAPTPNANVTPDDLTQFCRERLAGYKIPRRIYLVSQLPQTASGKIAKQQVAEAMQQIPA